MSFEQDCYDLNMHYASRHQVSQHLICNWGHCLEDLQNLWEVECCCWGKYVIVEWLWELAALPHFLVFLHASCVWVKSDQTFSCSCQYACLPAAVTDSADMDFSPLEW